jgi:hypothetical protein
MSEHDEQTILMQWAKYHEGMYPQLKWLHSIPNGAKLPWSRNAKGERYSRQATILKQEGLKKGIPDTFLPYPNGAYCGCYLELKYGTNTASDEQIEFANYANNHGYLCAICYGSAEAIAIIESYLLLQPGDTLDMATVLDKVWADTPASLFNKSNLSKHCKKVQP